MISKEEAKNKIKRLIDLYEKYQSTGQIDKFRGKEDNTKSTFIEPFFEALGWDIKNQEDIEVLKEEPILKGAVDYAFLIKGQYKFFIEAKAIGRDLKDIKSLKEAAEQSIRYGVNSNNKYVVLTNFEWIVIFNCELKGQLWEKWLFEPMNYKDYLANFEQKIWILSKESALQNELDTYAGSRGKRVPRTPVDKELLQKFLKWREKLSKDLKKYPEEEIDEFVQKLLIRLLFIRNCEDRGFETVHTLWSVTQFYQIHKRGLLKLLRDIFKYYDIYNGSIFKESEIDTIEFNEALLAEIINGLYVSEDGVKYDFDIIPADVMGKLYEQYLGHILKKTPQQAKLKEGKAHRKEQGIYYTPTYIVDYIVRNTLGELLKNKKVDASKIRVLDPACGSGSFLVKSFDVLNEYWKQKDKDHVQKTWAENWSETYSKKERILINNIFGVDLDKQAAEIAQLNLLLRIAEKGQKLPLLKQNIKIGNSLIDDESIAPGKSFKWEEKFKDIMKEGWFDIVIGNPPYVRIQTLDSESVNFFNSHYKSATKNYDIYALFVEKGLSLLKEGGILGFILPSKFFNADYGEGLRKVIAENKLLYKVVDFKDFQVFEGATTYTCLLFLRKGGNKIFEYLELAYAESLKHSKTLTLEMFKISKQEQPKSCEAWNFVSEDTKSIMNKLNNVKLRLGDICSELFVGLQTSADPVYIVKIQKDTGKYYEILCRKTEKVYKVEKEIIKPILMGKDIRRWQISWRGLGLLFPYKVEDGKAVLITQSIFEKTYPHALQYLLDNKKTLDLRENGKWKNVKEWQAFVYEKNLMSFSQPKLVTQVLASKNSFTFDEKGEYYFVGGGNAGGYGLVLKDEYKKDYHFVLTLLNSKLLELYLKKVSTPFRGRFYSYGKRFIEKLPVVMPSENDKKKLADMARRQLERNKLLLEIGDKKTDERARIEEDIKKTDAEIDELVYKIYGITEEEKKIIKESLK